MNKERLTYETELGISLDVKEDCPTMSICYSCDIPPSRCNYLYEAINKLAEYENFFAEKLKDVLMDYFNIGDSYAYNLTRVKESFSVGTMTFDDFEEFNEETIDDIVEFIKRRI